MKVIACLALVAALVAVVTAAAVPAKPLTPAEQKEVQHWVGPVTNAVKQAYRAERDAHGRQPTRFFHAKTHMGLHVTFHGKAVVKDSGGATQPSPVGAGIFAAGNSFPGVVRLSSGDPTIQKDTVKDLKGFALKVNAKDHTAPRNELPGGEDVGDEHSQDFIAATGSAHFMSLGEEAPLVRDSALGIAARKTAGRLTRGAIFLSKIVGFIRAASITLIENLRAAEKDGTVHNIFEIPAYHSQTTYEYRQQVVRYEYVPFLEYEKPDQPHHLVSTDEHFRQFREDQLYEVRYNTYDTLYSKSDDPVKRAGFRMYVRYPPAGVDVHDPTLLWPQAVREHVATIEIDLAKKPMEDADVESLAFNPWRGFVEHKPLGPINTLRRDLYKGASTVRVNGKFYCPFAPAAATKEVTDEQKEEAKAAADEPAEKAAIERDVEEGKKDETGSTPSTPSTSTSTPSSVGGQEQQAKTVPLDDKVVVTADTKF